jgi:corrinoid protein of di/trimethylamine methyltransferase
MTTKADILAKLSEAVFKFEEDDAREAATEALENNIDASEAILNGLVDGMQRAGELFKQREYFVPEVLLCADAMEEGMKILRPHISKNTESQTKGDIILGTVEGDIHSIGKNLVKLMLDTNGFKVHDLGEDVPVQRFVEEQKRIGADIVAMSTLMTTTMMAVEKAVPMIKSSDPSVAVMVGGAPFTREIAEKFGADGYAVDAVEAVSEARRMMTLRSAK